MACCREASDQGHASAGFHKRLEAEIRALAPDAFDVSGEGVGHWGFGFRDVAVGANAGD